MFIKIMYLDIHPINVHIYFLKIFPKVYSRRPCLYVCVYVFVCECVCMSARVEHYF